MLLFHRKERDLKTWGQNVARCLVCAGLVAVVVCAAWGLCRNSASSRRIQNLRVQSVANNTNQLIISGLVMDSAYAVKDIRMTTVDAQTIGIDLLLTLGAYAPSGSFEFTLYLKPETRKVILGSDRAVIWQRQTTTGMSSKP